MESYLKPVDTKEKFYGVKIKEEVSFKLTEDLSCIGEVKEECAIINDIEEDVCLDIKQGQSFPADILREENLLANIKTEGLNNINLNSGNDVIKEEEEIYYVWYEDGVKETDPLTLPEIKFDVGIVRELVPKVKTGTPSSAGKRELRICIKALS